MITRDEVELKAQEFKIHQAHVERDYVNGWFLAGLFTISNLKDLFVLKGGNCLRKAYFPDTRFTVDLDFSVQTAIDINHVMAEFNKICDFIQDNTKIIFDKERNFIREKGVADNTKRIYEARIYFKDFYGNPDEFTIYIRLDITEFDRIYLPVADKALLHPYSDIDKCSSILKCEQLEEVLATKLKCLLQRRKSTDLYDFVHAHFFDHPHQINTTSLVSVFLKKTIFEPSPGVVKGLLLGLPLEIFRNIWDKYIFCPHRGIISFDSAIENFKNSVERLFGHFQLDYRTGRYYPAEYRNLIFDAGVSRTLMKITYDGVERMVEPYELSYKRRKDGVGQEYFYVYDQTGGRSSGPGIKTFLNERIQSIENTDITFEPRVPIELSKMGQKGDKTYFSAPFKGKGSRGGSIRRRGRTRTSFGDNRVYIVQCPYCLREFEHATRNLTLRKHRDDSGYPCNSRRATFLYEDYR